MEGSPRFRISLPEVRTWLWASLVAGILAAVAKFIELGTEMDFGALAGLWPVVVAGLGYLVSILVKDTRPSPMPAPSPAPTPSPTQ